MNLKELFSARKTDAVAPYRQNRVSTKIGKSLADYYNKGESLKKDKKSNSEMIQEEREKYHAERTDKA